MDWKWLLFGLQGRINRAKYWLASFIILGALALGMLVALAIGGMDAVTDLIKSPPFLLINATLLGWISLATATKRLHDRNKGRWWLLLFFVVPVLLDSIATAIGDDNAAGLFFSAAGLAIGVWAFVDLCCLKGSAGPNGYGPDPLASPP